MATLFQNKYRIGFTRHAAWNYANSGMYFVTICTAGRICYFGNIINEKMRLNNIGSMAGQCWLEIPKHFPNRFWSLVMGLFFLIWIGSVFILIQTGFDQAGKIRTPSVYYPLGFLIISVFIWILAILNL